VRGELPSRATRGAKLLSAIHRPKKMAPVLSSTWLGVGLGLGLGMAPVLSSTWSKVEGQGEGLCTL
jgi:hypothetical protein